MICRRQRPDGGSSIRTSALPEQWDNGNQAENRRSERSLRIPPAMGIVLSSPNSFGEQKRSMVNLTLIKGLRAERGRAQKEVDRLEKAIAALGKLEGHSGRRAQRNETRKTRSLLPLRGRGLRKPRKHAGQNCASRRPLRPELKGSARMTAFRQLGQPESGGNQPRLRKASGPGHRDSIGVAKGSRRPERDRDRQNSSRVRSGEGQGRDHHGQFGIRVLMGVITEEAPYEQPSGGI